MNSTSVGFTERGFAIGTLFLLTWQIPFDWFRRSEDVESLDTGGDTLSTLLFLGLFAVAGVLALRVTGRLRQLVAVEPLIGIFVAYLAVSSLWSYDVGTSVRRAVAFALTTLFAYFLVGRFRLHQIVGMLGIVIGAGAVLSLLFVFALPQFGDSPAGWTGLTPNKNNLARIALLGFVVHTTQVATSPRFRILAGSFAMIDVAIIVGTTSGTAIAGLAMLLGLAVVYRFFRARKTLYGAVVTGLASVSVLAGLAATANLGFLFGLIGKDLSLTGRVPLWQASIGAILERPIFGYGLDGFWGGWFSPNHELWLSVEFRGGHSHNGLLELLLAGGVLAAGMFVAIYARAVHRSVGMIRFVPGATGLFPAMVMSWTAIYSVSERGIVGRNVFWVVFVVAVVTAADQTQLRSKNSEAGVVLPLADEPQLTHVGSASMRRFATAGGENRRS